MKATFDVERAQLVSLGHVPPDGDWHMPTHTHPHWEFVYFLDGCGRIEVPLSGLAPRSYHLIAYPPGLPHAEWADPGDPETTVWLQVDMPASWPEGVHLQAADADGKLRWLVLSLAEEYRRSEHGLLGGLYLKAFLCLVERAWNRNAAVEHDAVDIAIQHIRTQYARPIDLGRIAQMAHVSKSHLAHRFRERTGTSPRRYLQRTRISAAKQLLTSTEMPVGEVARAVGFRDPLYFSRVMKRLTGVSPTDYRMRARRSAGRTMEAVQ